MERTGAAEYLAECLWSGVKEAELAEADARAGASAEATTTESEPVRYLGSMLVPDDEVVFFFFAGPSPAAIERVARRAQIPFQRVLESVRVSDRRDRAT
jgi:hypothetical protein